MESKVHSFFNFQPVVDEADRVIDGTNVVLRLAGGGVHVRPELPHQHLQHLHVGVLVLQGDAGEEIGTAKVQVSKVRKTHYSRFHFFGRVDQLLEDVLVVSAVHDEQRLLDDNHLAGFDGSRRH